MISMRMTKVLVNAAILLGDDAQLCKQLYLLSRIFPFKFSQGVGLHISPWSSSFL